MKLYKHYSFDLWQTLIKSNPHYKRSRAQYFHDHFNPKKKTEDEVFIIIRDIEKMVDMVNQTTGMNIPTLEIMGMILFQLEYDMTELCSKDLLSVAHMLQQQFLSCPPVLYDKDTLNVLHQLHSEGATLSILSNTAFITGQTLTQLLSNIDIAKYFSFALYSDQMGVSKPNPVMFSTMIQSAAILHSGILYQDILHVGDNIVCDIRGAQNAGLPAFQINTNAKSIKNLVS